MNKSQKVSIKLQNGREIIGKSFGYEKSISGELVFNTGMVGYPESLTDPSYKGQILVITFPIIGIYGVPNDDKDEYGFLKNYESDNIHIKALIISDYSNYFQHYNSIKSLSTWLKENKIPAIYDVDTRALTKYIRNEGSMLCKIEFNNENIVEYYRVYKIQIYYETPVFRLVSCLRRLFLAKNDTF